MRHVGRIEDHHASTISCWHELGLHDTRKIGDRTRDNYGNAWQYYLSLFAFGLLLM